MTTWTKQTKASGTSWTKVILPKSSSPAKGSPIGLLMALTYATSNSTTWTKISKATGTTWTKVTKAT